MSAAPPIDHARRKWRLLTKLFECGLRKEILIVVHVRRNHRCDPDQLAGLGKVRKPSSFN